MSEHEDVIGIYGAIDVAVQNDRSLASEVADLLPGYRDGGAIGWFEEFDAWRRESFPGARDFPSYDDALASLAARPISGRTAARRIYALAAASRIQVHLASPDPRASIEEALAVDGITTAADRAVGEELLSLIQSDLHSPSDWQSFIEHAIANGVLAPTLHVQGASVPCWCGLVTVPVPGGPLPLVAAELRTSFTTNEVTFEQALRFLEPSNWAHCGTYWCEMRKMPGGVNPSIYHEIFSLNCALPAEAWTVEAYLEFGQWLIGGNSAVVSYRLANGYANPRVKVDEGWLSVTKSAGGGIEVETCKRIRFDHPFGGESLGMVMCALGYGEAAQHLVLDCAHDSRDDPNAGTDFPGTEPPQEPNQQPNVHPRARPVRPGPAAPPAQQVPPPNRNGGCDDLIDEAVGELTTILKDCAQAYKGQYDKVAAGNYTANDYVAMMADMGTRYLRAGAAMTDVALRGTRRMRQPAPPAEDDR
jgi:hypothetical protein